MYASRKAVKCLAKPQRGRYSRIVQNDHSLGSELSPRDLARSLGVSESSIKRWVDDGSLRARRTAGGHRRIAVAEAVRFARRTGTTIAKPDLLLGPAPRNTPGLDDITGGDVGERLFTLLEADDAAAARGLLLTLHAQGWPASAICDGPMRHAMERIGALWRHGPGGIVIEHRATDTCLRTLAEIRTLLSDPPAGAPVALGAAPGDDPYLLPTMMAATVLAEVGYRDQNLGPDVPIAVLSDAVATYHPRIVWLAMSVPSEDRRLVRSLAGLAEMLRRRRATLVVGGRGVPSMAETPGLVRARSMSELAAFARGMLLGPA